LSILRHLLRQLRHFHGDKARRRRRRKPAVVPWSFPFSRRGESRLNRGENGGFNAKWRFSWDIMADSPRKGGFQTGKWMFFFGENPSKMEVYRWEPFKIHRSHDGP